VTSSRAIDGSTTGRLQSHDATGVLLEGGLKDR